MSKTEKITLTIVRVTMGWFFFYAGITKVFSPTWSAAKYIGNAKSFTWFYGLMLNETALSVINFLVMHGLTLLGISLILGLGVRLSSYLGAFLMIMLYAPLPFPRPNANAFIIDDHLIYAATLVFLGAVRAGRYLGLDSWCASLPIWRRFPRLRNLLG